MLTFLRPLSGSAELRLCRDRASYPMGLMVALAVTLRYHAAHLFGGSSTAVSPHTGQQGHRL